MNGDIGVFLGKGVAAAALTSPLATVAPFQGTWDPERAGELVVRLREHFGNVNRIALAVGLGLLNVKPLDLPATGPVEQRRMLLLEPEKYFPVIEQGRYVAGIIGEPPLAFLLEAEPLERWISVFSLWAPVLRVDAAPVAAARAHPNQPQLAIPDGPDAFAIVEVERGRPTRLTRRATSDTATRCPPSDIALGAALGIDDALDDALMPDSLADTVMLGRRRRLASAAFAAGLALALTLWAVNLSRRHLLVRIDAAIATEAARPAAVRTDTAMSVREQAAVTRLMGARPNPVDVLAELSTLLPSDLVLNRIESVGGEWVIEGTANSASSVMPRLSSSARFENIRPLRPTLRVVVNGRAVDSFIMAFRARP